MVVGLLGSLKAGGRISSAGPDRSRPKRLAFMLAGRAAAGDANGAEIDRLIRPHPISEGSVPRRTFAFEVPRAETTERILNDQAECGPWRTFYTSGSTGNPKEYNPASRNGQFPASPCNGSQV